MPVQPAHKSPVAIDNYAQVLIDRQLLSSGSYSPLDLLIESGRLSPDDYSRWRSGDIETLDDVLRGNAQKLKRQLRQAEMYAKHLRLIAAEIEFTGPRGDGSLRPSVDKELRQLLCRRFDAEQNAPQLDMFFNNPVVTIINELNSALVQGAVAKAKTALDKLYQQDPNHKDLGKYDKLLDLLCFRTDPVSQVERECTDLLEAVPIAKNLLGLQARDFLLPQWRRLAIGLEGIPYNPEKPRQHVSYVHVQTGNWRAAMDSLTAIADWWHHVDCLLLLCESSYRGEDSGLNATAWFYLCWYHPVQAEAALNHGEQVDRAMVEQWRAFLDAEDRFEAVFNIDDFPAWIVLANPGLVNVLPKDICRQQNKAESIFQTACQLVKARMEGRGADELQSREQLQTQHPGLFSYWLATI